MGGLESPQYGWGMEMSLFYKVIQLGQGRKGGKRKKVAFK